MAIRSLLTSTALVFCIAALPALAQQPNKLDEVLKRGHLIVGTGSTVMPWHFKSADDKLQGFDIDMARLISKSLFKDTDKIEFVMQSPESRIQNITTGKVDITCQFMTVTGERAQQVAFTIPYYREGMVVLMRADSKYADYAALKAAGSGVTISSLQNAHLDATVKAAFPEAKIEQYDTMDLVYQALDSGRADGVPADVSSVAWFMQQRPGQYRDGGRIGWPNSYACAVPRGDQDWLNFVNTVFHEAMTGVEFDTYAKSYKAWFGQDLTPPPLGFPIEYK